MSRFTELKRLYIDKGLKIFPIVKNGKAPLIEAWQLDCSIDIPQIAYWLEHAKDCNWGMPCSENNIFVLDIDRHGVDGMESLKKLLTDLGIDHVDQTLFQRTPSNGIHLIYKSDAELKQVSNSSNSFPGYPGIDIRTDGYICVYPSEINGVKYELYKNGECEIAEMPPKLKEFILSQKQLIKTKSKDAYVKPEVVEKGNRDIELFTYINHLYFTTRLSKEEITLLANDFNENICDPSLPKRTVTYKVNKAFKKDRAKCFYIYVGEDEEE